MIGGTARRAENDVVPHRPGEGEGRHHPPPPPIWLERLTTTWVGNDLITDAQRERILSYEAESPTSLAPPSHHPAQSLAVEALGYLGGVIVVVAGLLLGFQVWDELSTGARLGLVGGSAVLLFAAGAAVSPRSGTAGDRLRSVLWLAAVPVTAGFFAVLGSDAIELDAPDVAVLATGGATVVAAGVWLPQRGALQQIAMMVTAAATVAVTIVDLSTSDILPGLGVWCVGVVWAVWAWGGVLDHRGVALPGGAAMAIGGSLTMIPNDAGTVLALLTAGSVIVVAVLFRDLLLLAVGALGSLLVLPAAVTEWWPDRLVAPLAMMALGVVLLLTALQVARHRRSPRHMGHEIAHGTPVVAWAVASPVVATVALVVILDVAGR